MAGTGPPILDETALTLRSAKSSGGGPLSGPGSRFLRRHTPGIGPGQLDASGQTIDTGICFFMQCKYLLLIHIVKNFQETITKVYFKCALYLWLVLD